MRAIIIFSLLMIASITYGQEDIELRNPSFEGVPQRGSAGAPGITGWFDCGIQLFPGESPPDIHPKNFWDNTKQASHGETYLGMVTRDNDSYESVSQQLSGSMQSGKCYTFSVELSKSERYISGSRLYNTTNQQFNYVTPVVLRIWGGFGYCNEVELLGETVPVKNSAWKTYNFKFEPSQDYNYITLQVYIKSPF